MDTGRLLPSPGRFLGAFTLATGLLLLAWSHVSGFYLAGLTALVNRVLELVGVSLALQAPFLGRAEMAYPGIAGGIALFAVTPRRPVRWKLGWVGLLVVLLGALHSALLGSEALLAVAQHTGRAAAGTAILSHFVPLCKSWGTVTLVLLVWFRAVRFGERPNATLTEPTR